MVSPKHFVPLCLCAFVPDSNICSNGRKGFTLVEVVIAIAILVILLGFIIGPMLVGFDYFHKGDARVDIRQNAVIAMDMILKDIREAACVYAYDYTDSDSDKIGDTFAKGDNTAYHCLWLNLPHRDTQDEVTLMTTGTQVAPLSITDGDIIYYFDEYHDESAAQDKKRYDVPDGDPDNKQEWRLKKEVHDDGAATAGKNALVGNVKTETHFYNGADNVITVDLTVIKTDSADGTVHRLHLVSKAKPMIK